MALALIAWRRSPGDRSYSVGQPVGVLSFRYLSHCQVRQRAARKPSSAMPVEVPRVFELEN